MELLVELYHLVKANIRPFHFIDDLDKLFIINEGEILVKPVFDAVHHFILSLHIEEGVAHKHRHFLRCHLVEVLLSADHSKVRTEIAKDPSNDVLHLEVDFDIQTRIQQSLINQTQRNCSKYCLSAIGG